MIRTLLITILALMLNGCTLADFSRFSSSKSSISTSAITSVPFRLLNNHILMPVKINGVEMEFILDSSAQNILVIDKSFHTVNNSDRTLPLKTSADQLNSVTIEIGDVRLSEVSAETISIGNTPGFPDTDSTYFDGLIGHHLLNNYIVKINYDSKLISLHSRKTFNKNRPDDHDGWSSVPMPLIDGQPFISMPVTLGENAMYLDFALNTGSNLDLKLPKEALTKALTPEYSYTFTHFDLSGKHKYDVYPLDRTFLGDHPKIWPLIHVPVGDKETNKNEKSENEKSENEKSENEKSEKNLSTKHISEKQYGMVGNAILSRFNLIIDINDETLYFQENQTHSIKNFPDRSGLSITPHKLGAIVTSVSAPAISLLKVKDIILSYEGIGITDATFDSFRLMLSSEAEQFQICWLREQEQQCGNLILAYRM